jgi:hypothetical protein
MPLRRHQSGRHLHPFGNVPRYQYGICAARVDGVHESFFLKKLRFSGKLELPCLPQCPVVFKCER